MWRSRTIEPFADRKIPRPAPLTDLPAAYLFSLIAVLTLLSSCSGARTIEKSAQAGTSQGVPVVVATVARDSVPIELRAIGNVEAYSTVMVKSRVDGELDRVNFKEGQEVRQGDLLFTIDPQPFEAALKQAEANMARDVAQEANAKVQANRYSQLFDAGIVSKGDSEQYRATADALAATVNADKAAVENFKLQLGYCSIRSQLDGRTGSLLVHAGNDIKANDATLVTINQISPIYVDFSVPEQSLPEIQQYQTRGPLKVEADISENEKPTPDGTLSFVDNTADSATGTIRLKAVFINSDKRLWPGRFVNVVLRLTTRPDAIVVPSAAVQTGQEGQYVYVVDSNHTALSRPVSVDWTFGDKSVIDKGLQPGEVVVTEGQLGLTPGTKVQYKSSREGT